MLAMKNSATILLNTTDLIKEIKIPTSKSWVKAAGSLRRHKKSLEEHVKKIRKEWSSSRLQ